MGEHKAHTRLSWRIRPAVLYFSTMRRIKTGKTVRIPESALPMLKDLRAKMEQTSHIGGLKLNTEVRLTDGVVIAWGLALANLTMNPALSLIDRKALVEQINQGDSALAELESDDDTRRAKIEMLIAGASEFSGYDTSAPLRAVPPEGRIS